MSGPFFLYKLNMQKYEHFKDISVANILLFFFLCYQDIYSQHCWVWWLTLLSLHLGGRKIAMSWRPGLVTVWDAVPQDTPETTTLVYYFAIKAISGA